jgi:hypothetical protein
MIYFAEEWRLHDLGHWKKNVRVVEGLLGKYGSYLESQGELGCLNISGANTIGHHQSTLTRFVCHQRTVNVDENSPHFEEEVDLLDLSLLPEDRAEKR